MGPLGCAPNIFGCQVIAIYFQKVGVVILSENIFFGVSTCSEYIAMTLCIPSAKLSYPTLGKGIIFKSEGNMLLFGGFNPFKKRIMSPSRCFKR